MDVQWPNARPCPQWIDYPCFSIQLLFLCHINVDVISYYPSSQLSISHSFLVCHTRHVASIIPNCHIPTRFHEKYDVIMKPLHMSIFREVYFALFAYNLYDHDAHTHAHIETLWEEIHGNTIFVTHQTTLIHACKWLFQKKYVRVWSP